MSRAARRFVARGVKGVGWRVWDNLLGRFWGPIFEAQPDAILAELNGARRGVELNRLTPALRRRVRGDKK
jgi:hypothetical protein